MYYIISKYTVSVEDIIKIVPVIFIVLLTVARINVSLLLVTFIFTG